MQSTNQQQTVLIVFTYLMRITAKITSITLWTSSWVSMFFKLTKTKACQSQVMVFGVMASTCLSHICCLLTSDAVATGNGEYLTIIHKQLLIHFFATPGFNEFAIEMLINILQCCVLLSEAEAHQCKWAATVNWNGGAGKNIEIDLFQENQNCEVKKLIKAMGANKTEKAIGRASQASGGCDQSCGSF